MLKFKCPKCGCTELYSYEKIWTIFPIESITEDGEFNYAKYDKQQNSEVISINCANVSCDFELPMLPNEEIVEWLKENCPQE